MACWLARWISEMSFHWWNERCSDMWTNWKYLRQRSVYLYRTQSGEARALTPWGMGSGCGLWFRRMLSGGLISTRSTEPHVWNLVRSASFCHARCGGPWSLRSSHSRRGNCSTVCLASEWISACVVELDLKTHVFQWVQPGSEIVGEPVAPITSDSCGSFLRWPRTHSPLPESLYGGKASSYLCPSSNSTSLHLIRF